MQIFDRRDPFLRFHVLGDQFHRAGTVKGDQRDDVVELLDVELLRQSWSFRRIPSGKDRSFRRGYRGRMQLSRRAGCSSARSFGSRW